MWICCFCHRISLWLKVFFITPTLLHRYTFLIRPNDLSRNVFLRCILLALQRHSTKLNVDTLFVRQQQRNIHYPVRAVKSAVYIIVGFALTEDVAKRQSACRIVYGVSSASFSDETRRRRRHRVDYDGKSRVRNSRALFVDGRLINVRRAISSQSRTYRNKSFRWCFWSINDARAGTNKPSRSRFLVTGPHPRTVRRVRYVAAYVRRPACCVTLRCDGHGIVCIGGVSFF